MMVSRHTAIPRTIPFLVAVCFLSLPAQAKYSGGTGTAQDPYQIATAADLIALGETPADYDKHFLLTADIDLDPNLPGRKVFDRAVIASAQHGWRAGPRGTPFTGVFDGNGHTISHVTMQGEAYVGLFGHMGSHAEIKDLGVVDVNITASGMHVGGLVGSNGYDEGQVVVEGGIITHCYSTGAIKGENRVGGLVGSNCRGRVTYCYSTGAVSGTEWSVGGLVGQNDGSVIQCYSTSAVSGKAGVGGLVGSTDIGDVIHSYSRGAVRGESTVGGLVGSHGIGDVTRCYSTGAVSGTGDHVGGLVGYAVRGWGATGPVNYLTDCFWNTQTSAQTTSDGGTGKTTAEMQTAKTFLDAGWDFVGEAANGSEDIWKAHPVLAYFS